MEHLADLAKLVVEEVRDTTEFIVHICQEVPLESIDTGMMWHLLSYRIIQLSYFIPLYQHMIYKYWHHASEETTTMTANALFVS